MNLKGPLSELSNALGVERLEDLDNLDSILRIYLSKCFKVRFPPCALIVYLWLTPVRVYLLFRTNLRKPGKYNWPRVQLKWKRTYIGAMCLKV